MHTALTQYRTKNTKRFFGFIAVLLCSFLLHTPPAHAAIGYYYQYFTCDGSCQPPTGTQIEGPYQAGNRYPREQQACTNLGFTRNFDTFEAPQRESVDSVACYEYYDARGSIYDFDGAGQEKTIYYGTAAPPPAPTATLTASPTSVAYNSASTLAWSSTNTTSCTGSGFSTGGAKSGSVSTGALTTNTAYSVTCTGAGGSVTAYASVSVGQAPAADLTAGSVTPTSGFANQAISFNSSATNIGNATSGSFPILFEIQSVAVFNSGYIAGLAQGATGYGSASRTLPAGTYQVRACANYNTSWTNIVPESNYSNNCGPWSTLTITTPPSPDLTASAVLPSTATAGQSVRLSGTTYNQGTGPAASYPNIFQIGSGGSVYQQMNASSGANPGDTNVSLLDYTFPSTGSYQVRLCANYNTSWTNIVAESDYSNNCGSWTTITVSASPSDLTAGAVTPTSSTAGQSTTFFAPVSNIGSGSTGRAFSALFQRATDAGGSNATDIGTFGFNTVNAGETYNAQLSYTFASAGTFYMRVCADKASAGDGGVITESNETNNCGSWTAITVSPAALPTPTCSLSASPSTIPSTLTWSSTNATTCTGGGFNTGNATSGTASVNTAGTYTLSCSNGTTSCPAQIVNVGGGACTNPAGTLSASPARVKKGSTSVITYSATGVTSCTLSGPGAPAIAPAACTVPQGSFTTPALTTQALYILTCDGAERARVLVNVVPSIIEF